MQKGTKSKIDWRFFAKKREIALLKCKFECRSLAESQTERHHWDAINCFPRGEQWPMLSQVFAQGADNRMPMQTVTRQNGTTKKGLNAFLAVESSV